MKAEFNSKYYKSGLRHVNGMSLIELMVSITISLLLVAGVMSVYASAKRSFMESTRSSVLAENGRAALHLLTQSIRSAGFYGELNADAIERDASLDTIANDCLNEAAIYNTGTPLFAITSTDGSAAGCISDAVAGTDVLFIKDVVAQPLSDSNDDGIIDSPQALSHQQSYIIANNTLGILLDGGDTHPGVQSGQKIPDGRAWAYRFAAYYIRNSEPPELSRKVLQWDASAMRLKLVTEDLVPGVENMQLLLAQDTDNNGEIDRLVTPSAVSDWSNIGAVELDLLIRSQSADNAYSDNRDYTLGNVAVDMPADHYHRLQQHATVSIRNSKFISRKQHN